MGFDGVEIEFEKEKSLLRFFNGSTVLSR